MYDREERKLGTINGQTPDDVGPGTYNINYQKVTGSKSVAPFGAMAERGNVLVVPTIGPGPGYYKTKSAFDKISGGKIAFKNGPRLVATTPNDNYPAPDMYFIPSVIPPKDKESNQAKKNKTAKIGVSFKPTIDPPSIPTPGMSYGYEFISNSAIRKQPPPNNDKTIGPAYYSNKTIETAPAVRWSVRSDKRDIHQNPQFRLNLLTPGPQQYEIENEIEPFFEDVRGKFLSEPRFKTGQKNSPAPTAYAISRFCDETSKHESGFFKSSTQRFVDNPIQAPAASTYHIAENLVKNKSFKIDNEKSPFCSSAARFSETKKTSNHLGPATYNVNSQSLGMLSLRQAIVKKTMKGGFGSSEPRKSVVDPPRSKSAGDIIKPGPGHYDINCEKIENKSFSMFGHSSFSSMSGRLGGNNYQAIPAPWDYNITQYSINYRVDKPSFQRNFKRAFNSSISRQKAQKNKSDSTPGPAAYEITKPQISAQRFCQSNRFVETVREVPVCTKYPTENSGLLNNQLVKKTFNVTLDKEYRKKVTQNTATSAPSTNLLISNQ